jgi:hypothetical protein
MPAERAYWFPAKRFGWGWGLPTSWQGWLVIACYGALLALGFVLFPPHRTLGALLAYIVALTAMLIAICWLKGEPPRWRWGNE